MADQNLTAEIEIKTNSPLAKKQLEQVEKQLLKLNKVMEETTKVSNQLEASDNSLVKAMKSGSEAADTLSKNFKELNAAIQLPKAKGARENLKQLALDTQFFTKTLKNLSSDSSGRDTMREIAANSAELAVKLGVSTSQLGIFRQALKQVSNAGEDINETTLRSQAILESFRGSASDAREASMLLASQMHDLALSGELGFDIDTDQLAEASTSVESIGESLKTVQEEGTRSKGILGTVLDELDELEQRTIRGSREFIVLVADDQVDVLKTLTGEMDTLNDKEKKLIDTTVGLVQGLLSIGGVALAFSLFQKTLKSLLIDTGFLQRHFDTAFKKVVAFKDSAVASFRKISSSILSSNSVVIKSFGQIGKVVKDTVMGFGTGFKTFFTTTAPAMIKGFGAVLAGTFKGLSTKITPVFASINKGLQFVFSPKLWGDIKNTGAAVKTAFIGLEKNLPNFVTFATALSGMKLGFEGMGSAAELASGSIGTMGAAVASLGAVVSGVLIFALKDAIISFVDLGTSALGKVIDKFAELSAVMENYRQETVQFEFVINNFSKVLGPEFAGTLDQWNDLLKEVGGTTAFTTSDIRKSIGLMVKESQILGFTSEQISEVIRRTADVAANSNKTLFDTTQRLVSGFAGMAQSSLALGVDLRQQTIQHGSLEEAMKDGHNETGRYALNQQRLTEFMKLTIPVMGASELQLNNLNAVRAKAADELSRLKGVFSGSAVINKFYAKTLLTVVRAVRLVPDSMIRAVGAVTEFSTVAAFGILTVIKWVVQLGSLVAIFVIFNAILATSVTLQGALTSAFTALGVKMGFTAVAVTGLNAVMLNLWLTLKATVVQVWATVSGFVAGYIPAILKATAATKAFLLRILPLVIKLAALVAVAWLLYDAWLGMTEALGESLSVFGSAFDSMTGIEAPVMPPNP
jgi:hypothetical protein